VYVCVLLQIRTQQKYLGTHHFGDRMFQQRIVFGDIRLYDVGILRLDANWLIPDVLIMRCFGNKVAKLYLAHHIGVSNQKA